MAWLLRCGLGRRRWRLRRRGRRRRPGWELAGDRRRGGGRPGGHGEQQRCRQGQEAEASFFSCRLHAAPSLHGTAICAERLKKEGRLVRSGRPDLGAPPEAPDPIAARLLDPGAQVGTRAAAAAERSEGTLDAAEHPDRLPRDGPTRPFLGQPAGRGPSTATAGRRAQESRRPAGGAGVAGAGGRRPSAKRPRGSDRDLAACLPATVAGRGENGPEEGCGEPPARGRTGPPSAATSAAWPGPSLHSLRLCKGRRPKAGRERARSENAHSRTATLHGP